MPVIDRTGERLGVVQVLNKRGGQFTQVDICRLKACSAGISVALENARLFSDVLALKNYNESILKSLSNGVVTLDRQGVIVKVNEAAQRILGLSSETLVGRLDLIQAKGISQPTWVYESLGHHTRGTFPGLASVIKAYEAGVDCYQRRDWKGGLGHFAEALELAPQDRPSRIFYDRCCYCQASSSDEAWDGVWIMQEK